MSRPSVSLFVAVALAIGALLLFRESNTPPGDEALMRRFHDDRPSYERLRDMLLADAPVSLVADWGIQTSNSVLSVKPPVAELSLARYDDYLALLRKIDGVAVSRSRDTPPEVCIYVWAAGFAGDTRHEAVCWRDQPPPDLVASLDEIEQRSALAGGKMTFVYRHVDSHWYLMRDE